VQAATEAPAAAAAVRESGPAAAAEAEAESEELPLPTETLNIAELPAQHSEKTEETVPPEVRAREQLKQVHW